MSLLSLCKKESQVKLKKTAFSYEKSRKSLFFCDFSLTFYNWKLFFSTLPDFLFYRDWAHINVKCTAGFQAIKYIYKAC